VWWVLYLLVVDMQLYVSFVWKIDAPIFILLTFIILQHWVPWKLNSEYDAGTLKQPCVMQFSKTALSF